MNRPDFVIIALRLFAVYLLVMGFVDLPLSIPVLFANLAALGDGIGGELKKAFLVTISLQGIVKLVACVIVWKASPRISKIIENGLPQLETESNQITDTIFLKVGIVIIGIFMITKSVPSLIEILVPVLTLFYGVGYTEINSVMGKNGESIIPWAKIVYFIVKITIGVFLVFASNRIVLFTKINSTRRSAT